MGGFYRGAYLLARRPLKATIPIHARGIGNIPREGPVILASNHYSWADPIMLAAICPRPVHYLAKSGLFKTRFTNWFFRANGAIPVHRGTGSRNDAAVAASMEVLTTGRVLGVYPEATRAPAGTLLPGKPGAVRMALRSGAPIVPIGCASDTFWPMDKTFPRFGRGTWLDVGEPIRFPRDEALSNDGDHCRKETEALMARIGALLASAREARDRRERWEWAQA